VASTYTKSLGGAVMQIENSSLNNIVVISGLRGETTAHSALENYTNGFLRGFHDGGLNIETIDVCAAQLISNSTKKPLPFILFIAKQLGRLGIILEYIYGIIIALKYFQRRRETGIFCVNVSRTYLPIVIILRMMGFTIIFWIVDYYPNRKEFTNRALTRYSDFNIAINPYIAKSIPQNIPQAIFSGATDLPVSRFLNTHQPGTKFRLLYAGKLNYLNCIDVVLDIVSKEPETLTLTLFGDGELEKLARAMANKFSNIEFHGLVPRERVTQAMQSMHGVLCIRRTDDDYYKGFFPSKLLEMLTSPAIMFISDMREVTQSLEAATIVVKGQGAEHLLDAIRTVQSMGTEELNSMVQHRSKILTTECTWTRLTQIVKGARRNL
jgi:glycosyltransferase involved in cell wall biosynthesis